MRAVLLLIGFQAPHVTGWRFEGWARSVPYAKREVQGDEVDVHLARRSDTPIGMRALAECLRQVVAHAQLRAGSVKTRDADSRTHLKATHHGKIRAHYRLCEPLDLISVPSGRQARSDFQEGAALLALRVVRV